MKKSVITENIKVALSSVRNQKVRTIITALIISIGNVLSIFIGSPFIVPWAWIITGIGVFLSFFPQNL